jgi:flotillin
MSILTGRIFAGHLRSIVGSMTVEEIITERQKLATEVLDGSAVEMAKIGLTIDSLQIQSIDDMKLGYIAAMAAPHNAAIQREAQIAQARADQAAAEAGQESARRQAEFARQTSIVQAQYKAEVDKAQAEAAQAGPLAQATAQQQVIDARAELAQREALLREQQLVAEVIKPAQAEAEKVRIIARADAERTEIQAAAAASNNRVALDQLIIQQLPQIVKEAAVGLSGANVNIINGADGMGEMAAGLVGQGLAILESVKRGIASSDQKGISEAK